MLESLVDDDCPPESSSSSNRNWQCSATVQALLGSGFKCFKGYCLAEWFIRTEELGMKIHGKDTWIGMFMDLRTLRMPEGTRKQWRVREMWQRITWTG